MNLPTNVRTETTVAEARIDRILAALAATEPPVGLEDRLTQRIAGRLAHSAKACAGSATLDSITHEPPALGSIALRLPAAKQPHPWATASRTYAIPVSLLAILLVLTTLTLRYRGAPTATSSRFLSAQPILGSQAAEAVGARASIAIARAKTHQFVNLRLRPGQASLRAAQGFAPEANHSALRSSGAGATYQPPPNLDAIALAETRAPSRPAPLLPLTSQEHLLLAAARPGGPIQLAALDQARASALRAAAQARQDTEIQRFVQAALAPIALSDALTSTRFREPPEVALSIPLPKPPQSLAF
jgi:hypothetical protein